MTRQDVLLAILAASRGRPYTPVQIQKATFLVTENLPHLITQGNKYHFDPYDYGPFDQDVYNDAETMAVNEFVEITQRQGVRWNQYAASDLGVTQGMNILSEMNTDDSDYIKQVSSWVRSLSFEQLVKAIYKDYPEMRANSVFRG